MVKKCTLLGYGFWQSIELYRATLLRARATVLRQFEIGLLYTRRCERVVEGDTIFSAYPMPNVSTQ